ncbi:MAG: fibronectin type III domain-containing protein [Eubacterium sp.]|nr:fibronectin type III domain-containing protein [Eubacterium sp.]
MKKHLSILLSVLMMLTAVILPASPALAADSGSNTVKNPYYFDDVEMPSGSLQAIAETKATSRSYNGHTYYTRGEDLYKIFTKGYITRSKYSIYVLTTSVFSDQSSAYYLIDTMNDASEDSRSISSLDGDYMRWSWKDCNYTYTRMKYSDGYYYYKLDLNWICWDTSEQEKEVDKVVNELVRKIEVMNLSDYEKVKYVHDYICDGTTYCDAALTTTSSYFDYVYSPYGALVRGNVVCQGYSTAFYRICKELGFNVRVITSDEGCHAWNLIQLNDSFYYVDVTWDDSNIDNSLGDAYQYFLVNYENLIVDDSNKTIGYEHLPEAPFQTDYYYRNYGSKIDDYDYNRKDSSLLSNCVVTLSNYNYTYNGSSKTPQVTVTTSGGAYIDEGEYTVSYVKNVSTGVAKAKIHGNDYSYSGSSFRQFRIRPAKMSNLKIKVRGAETLTLKWTAAKGNVSGYVIERQESDYWKPVKTVNSATATSAKITGLAAAKKHKFRIRAFTNEAKRKLYGAYSAELAASTKPKRPVVKLSTKKKSITVKWGKVSASGYQIQVSKSKNFKSIVRRYSVGSSTTSKKVKKLARGRKYYVRVRAYKKISGNTFYSQWSKVKSIKCK